MGALTALKGVFAGKESLRAPMDDPFIQLDRATFAEQLKIVERARTQGEQDLPASDTRSLDVVEADIVAAVADHFSRSQIDVANQIRVLQSRIGSLGLLYQPSAIGGPARTAVSDFGAEVANWRNRLATSRSAIIDSYRELRDFKVANGLTRAAVSVPPPIVTWSTIALSWLFETFANSLLLRLNDKLGFLGGLFAAATVALINIAAAYVAGSTLWPQMNLKSNARRTLALVGVLLWLAFALVWNLLAAHYRDAKSSGYENPEAAALQLFSAQPYDLDTLYSWGLFVAGMLCAFLAARAAYRKDDPYPGYGDIARRHEERCTNYADEVTEASEGLREIRDASTRYAEGKQAELGREQRELERIVTTYETLKRRFYQHAAQIEQTANALLEIYRSENRQTRTSAPPAHFGERWRMPPTSLAELTIPEVVPSDISAADAALNRAIAQVSEAFDAAIASFEPLDTLETRLADEQA